MTHGRARTAEEEERERESGSGTPPRIMSALSRTERRATQRRSNSS